MWEGWQAWWRMEPRGSLLGSSLLAGYVALLPSILILVAVHALIEQADVDITTLQKPPEELGWRNLVMTLLVSPLVETALLGGLLSLLARILRHRQWLAVVSALAWAGAHAWFYPLWFFGTVWSFYVFSRGWLAWRGVSYKHAFAAAALPHMFVNAAALLLQFFSGS